MSIKKRKIKNSLFREIKIFFLSLVVLSVLGGGVFAYVHFFSSPENLYINPVGIQNRSSGNKFEFLLQDAGIQFTSVKVASDSSYIITLKDGGQVIMSPNKSVQNQISSLQLILSRLTIEGKRFRSLDLRYDKPVVVF